MNATRLVTFNSWSRKCMNQAGWKLLNRKAKTPIGGRDKSLFVMVLTFKWNKQLFVLFSFCPRGFDCKWSVEQKQGSSWHSLPISLSDGQGTSCAKCVIHSLWDKSCWNDIRCLMFSHFLSRFIYGLCFNLTALIFFFDKWFRPVIEQCFTYLMVSFIGIMIHYIKTRN